METLDSLEASKKIIQIFLASFFYIFFVAKLIGTENKMKWFKRRERYTFFTRRGIFGEYINFGYPICWQGAAVFLAIYGVIIGVGYWYVFVY
ncbi:MAG: hypothetical protein RR089_04705 [Acidaminococcaceae bacterium]